MAGKSKPNKPTSRTITVGISVDRHHRDYLVDITFTGKLDKTLLLSDLAHHVAACVKKQGVTVNDCTIGT
jgi:hypothetical protein